MSEWKEVQNLFVDDNISALEICRIRTEYALEWYIRKAIWHKYLFYILTGISMVCPLLNAVAAVVCDGKLAAVILASVTTLATSILGMTRSQVKWNNYRTAAEYLKSEYVLFEAKVEPYNSDARAVVYMKTIEQFMRNIHIRWENGFQKKDEKDDNSKPEKVS